MTSGRPATAASGSELEMPLPNSARSGHDAVMLEAPQRAGAAEARLHFVADQQRFVASAPGAQVAHVSRAERTPRCRPGRFRGSRRPRSAARCLVRAGCVRTARTKYRACGSHPEMAPARSRRSRLTIHSFNAGMPPACCAPSVRPWKALSNETITFLARPPDLTPCVRHSLMAHSTASEAGGEQENLLQRLGQKRGQPLHQLARGSRWGSSSWSAAARRPGATMASAISRRPWPALAISTPDDQSIHCCPRRRRPGSLPRDATRPAAVRAWRLVRTRVGAPISAATQAPGQPVPRSAERRLHARHGVRDETVFFGHASPVRQAPP